LTLSLPAYSEINLFTPWKPEIKIINKLIPNNYHNFSELTPLRPIKSAIGPEVIAPTIAPKDKMEPNKEYCVRSMHKKNQRKQDQIQIQFASSDIKIHQAKGVYLST